MEHRIGDVEHLDMSVFIKDVSSPMPDMDMRDIGVMYIRLLLFGNVVDCSVPAHNPGIINLFNILNKVHHTETCM